MAMRVFSVLLGWLVFFAIIGITTKSLVLISWLCAIGTAAACLVLWYEKRAHLDARRNQEVLMPGECELMSLCVDYAGRTPRQGFFRPLPIRGALSLTNRRIRFDSHKGQQISKHLTIDRVSIVGWTARSALFGFRTIIQIDSDVAGAVFYLHNRAYADRLCSFLASGCT
jgi:hypothetical protein